MQSSAWIQAIGASLDLFLDRLDEAVIVLDGQRQLVHVNTRARRLLGYGEEEDLDQARCRLTTKGTDCERSCPLTFALKSDLETVSDFETVYHTRDGQPVPLRVTIIPLRSENGESAGAVEILRPTEPDFGFYLAGSSETALRTRRRLKDLVEHQVNVLLIGEAMACQDVARALHRMVGLPESLFWDASCDEPLPANPWPPGTLYLGCHDGGNLGTDCFLDGWWIIAGAPTVEAAGPCSDAIETRLRLPHIDEMREDLPAVLNALARQLDDRASLTPNAVECLIPFALTNGLEESRAALRSALAVTDGMIDGEHLQLGDSEAGYVEELLQASDPLAASEACLIREVLCRCGWRMQEAADRLGISRVTLWRKLREHGIEK